MKAKVYVWETPPSLTSALSWNYFLTYQITVISKRVRKKKLLSH